MKYAFVFGTSIYISPERTVSYADAETKIPFLKILSFYASHNNAANSILSIDADVAASNDERIVVTSNEPSAGSAIKVVADDKRVQIFRTGQEHPVLDVLQLDEHEFSALSSHIFNEIEAQQVSVVFKIKGDFSVGGHRIVIDGESLYVNGDSFANGVVNAHDGVNLVPDNTIY
ncbi:hypothetical protein MUGA111182_16735 [Mucilaginibacter galii]|uniref:Uncharacterized protein n=1 Tax=Mucilaginibacter galii TaxID=2005073 RepID=A0A917N3L2_9SPHI|nr:hypothetical protein [Mucilaginibacter galii]GGI52654.1 hypothetical protein GCM10011425_38660 [Mucilaginibacter galii]